MNRFLLILSLIFCSLLLQAAPHVTRNYVSRYYTTRDGLVQMQVGCIFQDRDGYMWFGTKYGASRFDGISFKNYTVKNGMPAGEVSFIGGWDDKIVMISNHKLVLVFPNDSILYYDIPNCEDIPNGKYNTIKRLDNNQLILFNVESIDKKINCRKLTHYIFNFKKRNFFKLTSLNENVDYCDSNTLITSKAICEIDRKFRIKKIADIPTVYSVILVDLKHQFYYLRKENIISKFRFIDKKFEFIGNIVDTKFQSYVQFIVLNDGSLLYFDGNWKSHFFPKRQINLGFDLSIVNYMLIDRENNLWIGTDAGVYNFFNLNIEEYKFNLSKVDNIWSILEDDNRNMWFGSYGLGLWKMDKNSQLHLMNKGYPEWQLQYMGSIKTNKKTLYFPSGCGITKYENNRLKFMGQTGASLAAFFDEEKKKLYYSGFDTLNRRGIYCGVGAHKNFFEVNKGLPRAISRDSKGRIVIGSARGLSYLIGDSVLIEDTRKHSYRGIISMSIDQIGRIWKGTENGIFVELPNGSEYRIAMNRIADPIYSIMVYHNKYLLAGGIRCLFIVNLEQLKSYSNPEMWEIGYDAGFTGLESGQNGFCEDHNGDVWLTTALSVLKFNPEKLVQSQKQIIPPIRLAKLYYSNDNLNWKQLVFGNNSIEISPSDKFLRFEYVANSISAPKSLRFHYRLKGFSDEWSEPIYNKTVDFTNVNYGKYQFEVQCSMDGAHWSQTARSPWIEIETPFWSSTVAYILYLVLFSSLVTGITFLVLRQNNKKKIDLLNKQKYENQLQLNTLRSKVIPHFTKNVLSAIGNFAMTNRLKASYYISVFSNFTHLTLSNADKNYISIKEELDYIRTYLELEKMRFGKRFDYKIEFEEEVPLNLLIPTMTLHTYCDNAIRHGLVNKSGNGLLVVRILKNGGGVQLEIIDNGIGRQRAKELGTQGNGQGLQLIQSQLDFYNQFNNQPILQIITDLIDNQGNPTGTKVELFIPNEYKFTIE